MLKSIIVAHDASEPAAEAFAYALKIAGQARVPVEVVRAIEPMAIPPALPDPVAGVTVPVVDVDELTDLTRADRDSAEKDLNELHAFARSAGIQASTTIREGALIEVLRELADPTDLIAVGMTGRFSRAGIGSSTKELVTHGPCPVLVAGGAMRDLARVLCVYDGSGASRRAVAWGADLARQAGWPLNILAVSSNELSLDDALDQAQALAADAQVIHFGPEDQTKAHQIETTAAHARTALLVMGAYADSWIHQLIFGDPAAQVLKHIDAPVVLVH